MRIQNRQFLSISMGVLALTLLLAQTLPAMAESLFRASTTYSAQGSPMSRSLFAPPIARQVGDMITIEINETTQRVTRSELKITRDQTINQNGSTFYNSMLSFFLDKLPFNTSRVNKTLQAPSFNGLSNANALDSKAEMTNITTLVDHISCQVVQVLPNGDLVVQGQKTLQGNKERTDLMVTGIVKPYYLNENNQINSNMVANLQVVQGGKGVISRQQNDGIANKIYQFFN